VTGSVTATHPTHGTEPAMTQPNTPNLLELQRVRDDARAAYDLAGRVADRANSRVAASAADVMHTAVVWLDHPDLVARLRPVLDEALGAERDYSAAVAAYAASAEALLAASAALRNAGRAR
jgi:hypothetical protein